MKSFLAQQLQKILRFLAQATIAKYQPSVIGVTGSVGKTSTKEAIYAVLKDLRHARVSRGNFNNEFGLPLAILGDYAEVGGLFFWLKVIFIGALNLIRKIKYPEILILEYGIQKPGDMRYLLSIAKPSIAVVTAIGEVPVHVEFFSGPESLAREKGRLVEALPSVGFAILNGDDDVVLDLGGRTKAHLMTFGFDKDAQMHVAALENLSTEDRPFGVTFKLQYGGSFVPVRFPNVFGKSQAYAAAAAACIGIIFGSNIVKISESLMGNYAAPPRRMNLIAGKNNSWLIDDSYNASPLSTHAAIDTVKDLVGKRKIGVLGDMRELGKFSIQAHEEIGRLAGKIFDMLITVGEKGKLIAAGASAFGMPRKNIIACENSEEASKELGSLLKEGDLVLIKASRSIGLDKVVDALAGR